MGETPHLFLQVQLCHSVSQPRCTAFIKYTCLILSPYSEVTLLLKKVILSPTDILPVLIDPHIRGWNKNRFNVLKSRICCKQKNMHMEIQKWCGLGIGHGVKKKDVCIGLETMVSESSVWVFFIGNIMGYFLLPIKILPVPSLELWYYCMQWLQNLTILDLKGVSDSDFQKESWIAFNHRTTLSKTESKQERVAHKRAH